MKVYLAAPYGARNLIRDLIGELDAEQMVCTSSWLRETHKINAGTQGAATALTDAQVAQHAIDDMRDIDVSDALVLFTSASVGVEGGGGRHVETGYALALGKRVIVVGEPENVFHRLGSPRVALVPDWRSALAFLSGLQWAQR